MMFCLNKPEYNHLYSGTDLLLYSMMDSNHIKVKGAFYIDYDGGIYSNQDCLPSDLIGSVFGDNLNHAFDSSKLKPKEYNINPEIFEYAQNNINYQFHE